jgi:hypothetical protein
MTPVVETTTARTGSDNTTTDLADRSPTLGGIRPVRATVRRPHDQ